MGEFLINGKVELRPDNKGRFDELVLGDENGKCIVHAEMMNDGCLWIGLYPPGEKSRVVMWINAKGKKLSVRAEED